MKKLFVEILPDTRSGEGGKGLDGKLNEDHGDNLVIIDCWQLRQHDSKHFAWRQDTDLLDRSGPLPGAPPALRCLEDTAI